MIRLHIYPFRCKPKKKDVCIETAILFQIMRAIKYLKTTGCTIKTINKLKSNYLIIQIIITIAHKKLVHLNSETSIILH